MMGVSEDRHEKEGRTLKPEDLNPIRDALRFLGRHLRRTAPPDVDGAGTVPASAESPPKRTWWTVAGKVYHFLGVALVWLILLYVGIALVRSALEGTECYGARFGVGNLYVAYSVDRGGLLSDRLLYAIIVPSGFWAQMSSTNTSCTLEFVDGNSVTVRPKRGKTVRIDDRHRVTIQPKRGDTVWIDDQYRVTSLGRVLDAGDFATLEKASYEQRSAHLSSPEEFLALVTRLRSGAGAAGEPSPATVK
jgi:hypothetical protein